MSKTNKVIQEIVNHYYLNFELGMQYLSFSNEVAKVGYYNFSKYLRDLADDKLTTHKDILFDYIKRTDNCLSIGEYKFNIQHIHDAKKIVDFVFNEEMKIREKVKEMSCLSLDEKDHESFHLLTWFVNDGIKDFQKIKKIHKLFELSDNVIEIDQAITEIIEDKE